MRFINSMQTPFENMAFCYHEKETVPETLDQVLAESHKIRGIFDPRIDTVYITTALSAKSVRSPFVPARYGERPQAFRDLIAGGFPLKTYSDAQQALVDQLPSISYMAAPRIGNPPAGQRENYRRLSTIDWMVTGSGSSVSMRTTCRTMLSDFKTGVSLGWIAVSGTANGSSLTTYPHKRSGLDTRMFDADEWTPAYGVVLLLQSGQNHNFSNARSFRYYEDGSIDTIPSVGVRLEQEENYEVDGAPYHERRAQHFTVVQDKVVKLSRSEIFNGVQLMYRTDPISKSQVTFM